MTTNDLVEKVIARAKKLADMPIDRLRLEYPEATDTGSQLIRLCKEQRLSRGDLIEAILVDEFIEEFPRDIP